MNPERKYSTAVVFSLIDETEFFLLHKDKREWIALMLGCEYVDLTDDSSNLNRLFELFPSGVTRAFIDGLIFELPNE